MTLGTGDHIRFTQEEVKHYLETDTLPDTYLEREKFLNDFGLSYEDPDYELKLALLRIDMSEEGSKELFVKVWADGIKKKLSKMSDVEPPATK
jgi:hypothetical protein